MKNLISMTDFVLSEKEIKQYSKTRNQIINYANFLKQPLKLWMFIPCDDKNIPFPQYIELGKGLLEKYEQAKERCLFENHDLDIETIKHHIKLERTVEYFETFETLQLTPTALKQIGL